MSTHYFHTIDEAFQVSLKVEEKVNRKAQQKLRGKGPQGRGRTRTDKVNESEEESTNTSNTKGNGTGRGRGFGRGKCTITYYRCGVDGHKASECPEKQNVSK